jgi:hypothetical protein
MLSSLAVFEKYYGEKLGIKLLFLTTCHPQIIGQTEVVSRTLTQILRTIILNNLKN